MSYTSNPINSQSLNGIISLSDGVLNIEDGVISNIQLLKVVGDSELDGNLIVDGKITCAYTALLGSDVVNKAFVDDAFNTNSRFLKVDGSNQMNADLNMGTKMVSNIGTAIPTSNQAVAKAHLTSVLGSYLPLAGGTMIGNIDMSGNAIVNIPNGVANGDAINKLQMDTADNLRLKIDGSSAMLGDLNLNNRSIFNVIALNGISGGYLNLQIGNATYLQLSTTSATFSKYITFNFTTGNGINMNSNSITNLSNGVANGDGINKLQMDTADNLRLKLDGSSAMLGDLNMGTKMVSNIGTAIPTSNQAVAKAHLTSVLGSYLPLAGGTMTGNINMNNTKILACNSIAGNINTNLVLNYLSGTTILPKISLTATQTLITDGLKIGNNWIDMSGNAIVNIPNGVNNGDGINKLQMDTADNLKMNKLNGSGTGMMTLTNGSSQLKLVSTSGSSNLILQNSIASSSCLIDFWDASSNVVASIQTGNASRVLFINAGTTPAMEFAQTYLKCKLPTQITGGLTMTTGGLSSIDMSGNTIKNLPNGINALDATNKQQLDLKLNLTGGTLSNTLTFSGGGIDMNNNTITNTSNIHSFGTNPIYLNNNAVAKVKIDASGITMQNNGNIDMNSTKIINLVSGSNPNDAVNRNDIATSLIPITAWHPNELIQTILKGNWLGQVLNNYSIGAGQVGGLVSPYTSSIFYSFSFTPKSTSSIIYATFDGNFTATGTNNNDTFKCYIGTNNGSSTTQERMLHSCFTGGIGLRGVSCFPINASWENTTTTPYTIGCYFDLTGTDDTITFTTQFNVKIQEFFKYVIAPL